MGAARFTLISPECVRIEYSPRGSAAGGATFVDAPTLLAWYRTGPSAAAAAPRPVVIDDTPGAEPFELSTERMSLRFAPHGRGFDEQSLRVEVRGPLAPAPEGGPQDGTTVWHPGKRQTANLGGTLSTLDGLRRAAPLPEGLLSRDGWYVIDDSAGHLLVDGWVRERPRDAEGGAVDWYLLAYGRDYRAAMRAFTRLSGPVPVPRKCMLGSWYSRYWPHTSSEYREIVERCRAEGLPLDVLVLDMDWHRPGWTGWSWNRDLLPDAEALLEWCHRQGLAVTLNLHPADGVGPHEDRYGDFMRALGRNPADGDTVPFDAGDRRYMEALFRHIHAPLEEDGVDFWWLDWQQDRLVRSIPGLTNLQWLNHLYFQHSRRSGPDGRRRRGASFSRWAGDPAQGRWGDHRHPIHFSGDAHTGWEMLAFQVPFTATAGNVGCFFWSHDIGGHFGPRDEEATTRWVQFGCLSASVRLHSARSEALDRRPWSHAPTFYEAMRSAMRLRRSLMPHLYSEVRRSCANATPFIRPMYWDCPEEPRAYGLPGQYMLGDHLLAAPIVTPGIGAGLVATQVVWFPPEDGTGGGAWRRWDTGERYLGGDEAIVAAEIGEVPLFVREGVPIGDAYRFEVWAPEREAGDVSVVREWVHEDDDGVSDDEGAVARTPVRLEWSPVDEGGEPSWMLRVAAGPTVGAFAGLEELRAWDIRVRGGANDAAGGIESGHRRSIRDQREAAARVKPGRDAASAARVHRARRLESALPEGSGAPAGAGRDDPDGSRLRARLAEVLAATRDPQSAASLVAIGAGVGLARCDGQWRLIDTLGWVDGERAEVEVYDEFGARRSSVLTETLALRGGGRSRGAMLSTPGRALAPPPVGLRASRWARVAISLRGTPVVFKHRLETRLTPLPALAWRVAGPFAWNWAGSITEQTFSPEVGGGQGLRERDWHDAGDGSWVPWVAAARGACGGGGGGWPVDLAATLGVPGGLGYAVTAITSSRRQAARLHVDCPDKFEAWLNRVKVFSLDSHESEAAREGGADIVLPQGRSVLLVKCASGWGEWGFGVSIEGDAAIDADHDPDHAAQAAMPRAG